MTVQKLYAKNIYKGNGSNKSFPFTFECPENHPEFVRVFVRENYLTETTNFAIDMQNRIVTYPVDGDALPEGANIIITRELPLTQVMNLINNGPFFAEDIETSLDEIVMMIQQLNEKADRSLTVEVDSTENPNDVIGQIFDARNLTQTLAEEAAANASASLQSEQNAKASETLSAQYKADTDENRTSVEQSKSQVDSLLSEVIAHEETVLGYVNNSAENANQAKAYEESSRANAATAADASVVATTKAGEASASEGLVEEYKTAAQQSATLAEQYKNLAYQYMQGSVNIPVGTPLLWSWGEDTIPVGFIRYTTSSLSATTYPDLFGLVGHKYGGEGDEFYLPPDLYGRFMEISDVGGEYHEAGLPNIEGLSGLGVGTSFGGLNGAFSINQETSTIINGVSIGTANGVKMDASQYNEIYGNSDTVQPKSITAILIIKAFAGANPKATDLEITKVANDVIALGGRVDNIDSKVGNALSVVAQGDGYIRYSNGTQIVWGEAAANWSGGSGVTIDVPFVDNYTIQCTTCQQAGVNGIAGYIVNQTPTSFSIFTNQAAATNTKYLCVGRWK